MNEAILTLFFARDNIPDLTAEAFLASKPGVIGAIGSKKIFESHAEQEKRRKEAEAAALKFRGVIEDVARLLEGKEATADVTPKMFDDALKRIADLVALDPKHRKEVITNIQSKL